MKAKAIVKFERASEIVRARGNADGRGGNERKEKHEQCSNRS